MSRRHALLFAALALTACGGGDNTSPPPAPPPPPPAGAPSSVAVQAGDGQSANAGTGVPVAPSVVVKDQNARPVAGAAVAFAVDSGGGAVTAANAVTGSDGVASSGGWALGLGRNRLRATVAGLPPVFFTATATGDFGILDNSFGPGGGSVTLNKPGNPLNGMQITVPAGAFGSANHLTVGYGDSTGAPRKAGLRLASPVMTIGSDAPLAAGGAPIKLSIPVALLPGEWPIAILFNRATGAIETLPTIPVGTTGVIAFTRVLDGTDLAPPGPAAASLRVASPAAAPAGQPPLAIQLVIGAVAYSALQKDFDTGYRPSTDDWEFDNIITAIPSAVQGEAISGLAVASAWYFSQFKQSKGALNKQFQEAKDVELSNPRGLKLGVLAALAVDRQAIQTYNDALLTAAGITGGLTLDSLAFLSIKAGIFTTGRPQVLIAADPKSLTTPFEPLLAYGTTGNDVDVTLGTNASGVNAPRRITLTAGRFAAFNWGVKSPETDQLTTYRMPNVFVTGLTSGIPASRLNQLWQDFFNKTIAVAEAPSFVVSTRDYHPVVDTLFVPDDTTRVWVECAGSGCDFSYQVTGNFTPQGKVAAGMVFSKSSAGIWTKAGSAIYGKGVKISDADDLKTIGLALVTAADAAGTIGKGKYGDWTQFVIKTKRLTIAPDPLKFAAGFDFTVTATYKRPTPAGATWVWELGDGRSLTTTTNTLTAQYPAGAAATYDIKVSMKVGKDLEATGHVAAKLVPPEFVWQLQTATVQGSTLPAGGLGPEKSDTTIFNLLSGWVGDLQANPTNGVLFLSGVANGGSSCLAAIVLEQFPAGQVQTDSVTFPAFRAVLGVCGAEPDYSGNLTMGPLGNGTLIGTASESPNLPADTIVFPGGSINARMTGKKLTGTFVWNVGYSNGLGTYTVSFTANQIRP
ncbi:MAG: hypothetical protein ABI647_20940 [Gemmatimonadota bacterium]